jgi:hypothetical protein
MEGRSDDDDDDDPVQMMDGDEETDCPGIQFSIQSKLPFTTQSIINQSVGFTLILQGEM